MPKFIFSYRQPNGYSPAGESVETGDQRLIEVNVDAQSAWSAYFEHIGPRVIDPGQPVFERTSIGTVGESTKLGGYSIVDADNLEVALALAKECPTVCSSGGVEIGVLAELPTDHPAALLKNRLGVA